MINYLFVFIYLLIHQIMLSVFLLYIFRNSVSLRQWLVDEMRRGKNKDYLVGHQLDFLIYLSQVGTAAKN